ncbi:MAG: DHHA1 domain-containing protein [Desulfurococcales archaeon]|jgi:single-stranded DNA-specific DHH superfamily exonuclease
MRHVILVHGDCDGIIAGALYVKHFLRDRYPSDIVLGFTQPWRASKEIRKLCKEDQCESLTLIDIAIDREVFSMIVDIAMKGIPVQVIDHHATTEPWVEKMKDLGLKVIWDRSTSTPRLMFSKMKLLLNNYEAKLLRIADSCEGSEDGDEEIKSVADNIKLAISRDPSDLSFMRELFDAIILNKDLSLIASLEKKAYVGRLLLNKLIEKAIQRGEDLGEVLISYMHPSESRLFAGLFGIASTELSKKLKKDIVMIRDEETKIVVTVRSSKGRALHYCKTLVETLGGGKYGGHKEAASATLVKRNINDILAAARDAIWSLQKEKKS